MRAPASTQESDWRVSSAVGLTDSSLKRLNDCSRVGLGLLDRACQGVACDGVLGCRDRAGSRTGLTGGGGVGWDGVSRLCGDVCVGLANGNDLTLVWVGLEEAEVEGDKCAFGSVPGADAHAELNLDGVDKLAMGELI